MENTRKIKVNDHLPRMYEILEKYAIPRDHLILEDDLKISIVLTDNLLDVSRHIHTNPSDWMDYPY